MINLVGKLQDIQEEFGYLKREKLEEISREFNIPLARIFSLATFYRSFSLTPPAKHTITVCTGTACYVRGAPRMVEEISRQLGIDPGETTDDLNFQLETANCLGACALGPLVLIDNDYHGNMTPVKIAEVLDRYR
jgi:NADH-quinone oxidoreductase subunit E